MISSLWFQIVCVAIAGAAGALCRWGVTQLAETIGGPTLTSWHFGTLAVNLIGCFAFGLLYIILLPYTDAGSPVGLILLTGFMGAFTTFSAFAFDTYDMQTHFGMLRAGLNIFLHVGLGYLSLIAGMALGRLG